MMQRKNTWRMSTPLSNANTSVEALIAIEGPADLTAASKEDTRNVIISARSNVIWNLDPDLK